MISKARIYDINFKIPEFSYLSVFEHAVVVVASLSILETADLLSFLNNHLQGFQRMV